MSANEIRTAMQRVRESFRAHPELARSIDVTATARIESGLRVVVEGPEGRRTATDMPTTVGGSATTASPGWMLRAAHAACDATVIAMCAAEEGIELDELEVTVDSDSDDRGLFGLDDAPAGPLVTRVRIRIAAAGVPRERLEKLIERAERRSPVEQALLAAARVEVRVDVG